MSEFDFLSKITLGQYFPTNSVIHRVDPRMKIAGFTILILAITFSTTRVGLGIGILALLIGIVISRVKLGYALKGLLPPLPFLIFIALLQFFFVIGDNNPIILLTIGRINITLAGVWAAVVLLIRFVGLILCLSLMSFCISTSEMIQGIKLLLKPLTFLRIRTMDIVMILQVMLRYIPFLVQTAERIAKAQASRGADWGSKTSNIYTRMRQVVPLVIPLFLISLRRGENMALAMDARAYGCVADRTSMYEFKMRWADVFFLLICIMLSYTIFCV